MKIRRVVGERTGIYRDVRWVAGDLEGQIELWRRIARGSDLAANLDRIERWGVQELEQIGTELYNPSHDRGTWKRPGIRRVGRWAATFPKELSAHQKGISRDAQKVLWETLFLRDWLKKRHAGNIALHAFRLGVAVERLGVRAVEPIALRGRQHVEGSLQAWRQGKAERRTRDLEWKREAGALRRKNPQLSERAAAKIIRRKQKTKLSYSVETIRKAISKK